MKKKINKEISNKKKYILCFDLDNVICNTKGLNYKQSTPKKEVIKLINKLYNDGNIIKIFTARYMGRNNENSQIAKKKGYNFTLNQLNQWKLKFHKLIFGKPTYDLFVDDKSYFFRKNWYKNFRKKLNEKK